MNEKLQRREGEAVAEAIWLERALAEVCGGERAPDVAERVAASVAAGVVRRGGAGRLLVVAGVMLGVAVLFAVAWSVRDGEQLESQDPHEFERVYVDSIEGARELPISTAAVVVLGGDAIVAAVAARCADLRVLEIEGMTSNAAVTNDVLEVIATLTNLRKLRIDRAPRLTGEGFACLRRLPLLERLRLRECGVTAKHLDCLPLLPSLRALELSFCLFVGDDMLAVVARCPGLRELAIPGCSSITGDGLQHLGALVRLRALEVRRLQVDFEQLPLERMTGLRAFDAADAAITHAFLERMPEWIEEVSLQGTDLDDAGCALLRRRLSSLRSLSIVSTAVTHEGVQHLLQMRSLRELDMSWCGNVTGECADALVGSEWLLSVSLGNPDWVRFDLCQRLLQNGVRVAVPNRHLDRELAPLRERYRDAIDARAARLGDAR